MESEGKGELNSSHYVDMALFNKSLVLYSSTNCYLELSTLLKCCVAHSQLSPSSHGTFPPLAAM